MVGMGVGEKESKECEKVTKRHFLQQKKMILLRTVGYVGGKRTLQGTKEMER